MHRLFCSLLFLLAAGSVSALAETAMDPSAEVAAIVLEGTTVTYAGTINEENIDRFLDTVHGRKISVLVIASGGGDIVSGMRMGEWVFDHQVDVMVERMCMSSCANYVFTAGRRKTINFNSVVAWHGSVLQESGISDEDVRKAVIEAFGKLPEIEKAKHDLEAMVGRSIRQMRDYRKINKERQARFFSKIGVDEHICRIGNEKYGAEDFFILSVKDMERYGVRDVSAPEDYEKTDLAPLRRSGKKVVFIRLDEKSGG